MEGMAQHLGIIDNSLEEIARPRQGFVPALYVYMQARKLKSSKEATKFDFTNKGTERAASSMAKAQLVSVVRDIHEDWRAGMAREGKIGMS
ncbi:hypothetical protein llap_9489 [Limosa lapponica baueri]|uniref:Uncharacterized protein n=1 Tax=Limosa lapponica baueri TaxID=1758121 RepID=A0A2I0U2B6_LIMLA|nr:hypothetical protein llap_9489 [Limosa lapponica baueri]